MKDKGQIRIMSDKKYYQCNRCGTFTGARDFRNGKHIDCKGAEHKERMAKIFTAANNRLNKTIRKYNIHL